MHHSWLERTIAAQPGSLEVNLELQYRQLQDINRSLAEYNQQIEAPAQTERYQKPVQALTCYKGIKTIFALTMITEIDMTEAVALRKEINLKVEKVHGIRVSFNDVYPK